MKRKTAKGILSITDEFSTPRIKEIRSATVAVATL